MDNHKTTTRVYWQDAIPGATPGWEAQRNDGHSWHAAGELDDDDDTIAEYAEAWAPAGLEVGTITVERDPDPTRVWYGGCAFDGCGQSGPTEDGTGETVWTCPDHPHAIVHYYQAD